MKNKYKIVENYVVIYLNKGFETYIDLDDFDKVDKINYRWIAKWYPSSQCYFAVATIYLGVDNGVSLSESLLLHRLVMGETRRKIYIDHINHNTLDNRKGNLRKSINAQNSKNRKSKNSNNTSGYRNVSKLGKWWGVQLQIEGKNTLLKKFPLDQLEEAGTYAELMRKKYYGEFAGKN